MQRIVGWHGNDSVCLSLWEVLKLLVGGTVEGCGVEIRCYRKWRRRCETGGSA